ncbi:NUDIX hydrolase [Hamadaea tsunoensis]|uniref:NUDIX hydrolase n=1 Tax=Hamadaea tsunoensis TaxID=53368 RepID=UPI00146FBAC9|nr:NUDIX domain-containing protein [Hamadaea tsunoensis]
MPLDPAPISRPSVRVLLIDDADRLLLFSSGARADGTLRWFTAGGGVHPGESHEQAALREIREETGLTGVTLGREVWRGRPWNTVRNGVTYEVEQRYYLARVTAFEIDTSSFEDFERATITGHRWWTVSELAATNDTLRPAGLPQLLAHLLSDGPPDEPIIVSG